MKTKKMFLALTTIVCSALLFSACKDDNNDDNPSSNLPTVLTVEPSSVKASSVETGGIISSDGGSAITDMGVCYATTEQPTINNSKVSAKAGTGSYVCSITGLTVNTTYYFRAYATNAAGTAYGIQYTVTTKNPVLATLTTAEVTEAYGENAMCGGNITKDGNSDISARGVCWSKSENPTVSDSKTEDGTGTGEFTSKMTGLTAGTTYYVRAYATNDAGTAYGEQRKFSPIEPKLATVTSKEVTEKTLTGAQSGGEVTADGGVPVTARGVCWSTKKDPTINDSKTSDGTGVGEFTSAITGLTEGTVYYMRAYATNMVGTAYGEQRTFAPFYLDDGSAVTKITGGTFTMGGADGNGCSPTSQVTLPDYYLAKTEVTQKLFLEVMGSSYSQYISYPVGADNYNPMPSVTWGDAVIFCNKLNILKGYKPCYSIKGETDPSKWDMSAEFWQDNVVCDWTANGYRLPNIPEWEYAAGGGATNRTKYAGTDDISELGLYGHVEGAVPGEGLFTVATRLPNKLGIYDMDGNATEWCWEWSYEYNANAKTYPGDMPTYNYGNHEKVKKGGSIWNWGSKVYLVYSNWTDPVNSRNWPCGFRLARTKVN